MKKLGLPLPAVLAVTQQEGPTGPPVAAPEPGG